jgi:transcriptional regulator with XRE-family HTH domain
VEGGHTIPSVETLEKFARALEVPLYQLFYEGKKPPKVLRLSKRETAKEISFGHSKKEAQFFHQLGGLLARIKEPDRQLLLHMAQKMSRR